MPECCKCKNSIRGETGIRCAGVCGKIFHITMKCSGLDQYSNNMFGSNKMIKFMCEDCVMYIHNVDLVLKDMQVSVNKSKDNLSEYKSEFEDSLKKHEAEIKNLLETIEERYMERLNYVMNAQKKCEKNIKEMQKLCSVNKNVESQNEKICEELIKNNNNSEKIYEEVVDQKKSVEVLVENLKLKIKSDDKIVNEIKKVCSETRPTFAEIAKKIPCVVVKPKKNQSGQVTEKDIKSKIIPSSSELKISGMAKTKNGSVIVSLDNNESVTKLKDIAERSLNDDYKIELTGERKLRVKIVNISEQLSEANIINSLKIQNNFLQDSEMTVKKIFKTKKIYKPFVVVLETDTETYNKLMSAGKVNLEWDKCGVYDGFFVRRCFRCLGFGHKSDVCKAIKSICADCAEEREENHKCESETKKCSNCCKVQNDTNLKLDIYHSAFDTVNCKVYQRKVEIEKKKLF